MKKFFFFWKCVFQSAFLIVFLHLYLAETAEKLPQQTNNAMENRLSNLEKEFKDQKKHISDLETKQEAQSRKFQEEITALKNGYFDIMTKHKTESPSSGDNTKQLLKLCADTSRLCTFYYPDHPDIVIGRNESHSRNNAISRVFMNYPSEKPPSTIKNEPLKQSKFCSDSSSFCTYFYPDHPDAKAVSRLSATHKNQANPKTDCQPLINENKIIQKVTSVSNEKMFNGPPTNCSDLNLLGQTVNGFYLVKGSGESKSKVLIVFCNFQDLNTNNVETKSSSTFIGYANVKSSSGVYFHVQNVARTVDFGKALTFQDEILNIGKGMNLATGIFSSPVSGIYHFVYKGYKTNGVVNFEVYLLVNDVKVERAYTMLNSPQNFGFTEHNLHATIRLNSGDKVTLVRIAGDLWIKDKFSALFCGWLIEEELVFKL